MNEGLGLTPAGAEPAYKPCPARFSPRWLPGAHGRSTTKSSPGRVA